MSELGGAEININVGAFLPAAIDEGLSARAALGAFREAGGSISNQAFRSMYAAARDALANRDVIAGLDYGQVPGDDAFTEWAAGAEGQFATFVESFVRMPGEREVESRFFTFVSDEPHTPQEAVDAASAWLTGEPLDTGGTPRGIYQGSVVTSMTRTVSRG